MKPFFSLIVFISFSNCLIAQPDKYQFAQLDINAGLSHNNVTAFLKDKKGFLWIGTQSGLNRYDGYTLKKYFSDLQDSTSMRGNNVLSLFELPEQLMAVVTNDGGLSIYDPFQDKFQSKLPQYMTRMGIGGDIMSQVVHDRNDRYWFVLNTSGACLYQNNQKHLWIKHNQADPNTIASTPITSIVPSKDESYWIIHADGVLEQIILTENSYRVAYRNDELKSLGSLNINSRVVEDQDGDLWICLLGFNQGIYYFNNKEKTFTQISKDSKGMRLNTNLVSGAIVDALNNLWIGTDHGGVNIIDKKQQKVYTLKHQEEGAHALGQNSINTLYRDDQGIIWIGTFKRGVSYYHENLLRFPLFQHSIFDKSSLPFNDVNRFVEDAKGNLWIGTNGAGLIYFDRKTNSFQQYRNDPQNINSLSSDVIVSLLIDSDGVLWIGTFYGGLNSFDGKKFKRYLPDGKSISISGRSVWEIFEDSKKQLWIGTLDAGLDLLNRKTSEFKHFQVGSTYISSIMEDHEGNLWVGTNLGIDVSTNQGNSFTHYANQKGNLSSLSNNSIMDMREDKSGRIWIATQGGLNLFQKADQSFKVIREQDGLPSNTVLTLLVDNNGNLWMSTVNGISKMILNQEGNELSYTFRNYDETDGLQGKQFNENAALKTRNGELVFGGPSGFNIFKPEELKLNLVPPKIVLTDFQLFNKSIKPKEKVDNAIVLEKSISESSEITLKSSENVFSLEFVALNFLHAEKNKYKYQLVGFNKDWLMTDAQSRRITFTNLDPGDYTFRVMASNNDGIWNNQGASLKIKVLPPFWKTNIAFGIYLIFILTSLYITRKLIQQRERMKFAIRQERQEAVRMHQLDMMKIKFFTNVSHEFRTPLSLILVPMEKLLNQASDPEQQKQFQLIQRNAKRLLNLVNQLLDFRKMEVQELKFNPSEGDIIAFLEETVSSFSDLSEKKHIHLEFKSSVPKLETFFDKDKLEKIVLNLLSNAFKFTHENGSVNVSVNVNSEMGRHELELRVKDSGIGIPHEKQGRIFDRFFQNDLPRSMVNQGSGIGLSITKEFVRIHEGTITVESDPGKGSCFIVVLPVREIVGSDQPVPVLQNRIEERIEKENIEEVKSDKPLLILVEDNEDFRFYLKDNLSQSYQVI
ncbi:MAG TPA: two-component regulator propeller domain-containing protein, partial [Cyclobacteriaceae bacterium]|nr:two-component regulator propeller domain-containing protein [Cyclobacteriaceae bacterium]